MNICRDLACLSSLTDAQEKFRDMQLKVEYDPHDPIGHSSSVLPKRTKISEIVVAGAIIIVLPHSGVCAAAFSRETNERICILNVNSDEVIRSLFYNKYNDSLITVSVHASDNYDSLKCRSTMLEYIRRGQPDAGSSLFGAVSLKWPGFVEFDDVNGKVLVYSVLESLYKVFDLKDYTMLYSISDKDLQEIKISTGIMLLIFVRASSHVFLKILSIEDGTVLKAFNHPLHQNKRVDIIDLFNEKLLVKQKNENLQILDVHNAELREVSKKEFTTPSEYIFLPKKQLLLTFSSGTVAVWNFFGELVTTFEDHLLGHPYCNTNCTYITSDQNLIISYCISDTGDVDAAGSVNISNILTGKCLAKINVENCSPKIYEENSPTGSSRKQVSAQKVHTTVAEALEDITAIFYDEEHNEIYTGNSRGLVHVWSKI